MKKALLSTLRVICAGAMSLYAVSCYDDSALREDLAGLENDVTALAARVDSLEKNLNDEIKNVNNLASSVTTLETSLQAAIQANGAAVQEALEAKLAALDEKLAAAIAEGDQALADALAAEKAAFEVAMQALQDGITSVTGDVEDLAGALATLEATIGAKYTELLTTMDQADGRLDGKIADLAAGVEAAKKQYADATAALSEELLGKIAEAVAKIAVVNVDVQADKVVLTLANGETVELSKPVENADNNGLVTIITDEETGAKYWAVVVDGEPQSLDIMVGSDVQLEFDIVDGELMFSTNGTDWASTGAFVADDADNLINIYQGETDEMDWETYEFIKEDFYTVEFGGETYYLPLYKVDNSVVTIKAGKTYFAYGESKTIDVAVADVNSMYVMTKPDGWRANLAGNKLTVTAPAEAAVTAGYAEADGEILLHCSTKDGHCKIAKLAVSTTDGFSLTVNADGTFTLVNPILNVSDYGADFGEAVIGLADVSSFEKDPKAYVDAITNGEGYWDDVVTYVSNWKNNTMDWDTYEFTIGGMYMPGEYEVDVIESSVADLYTYYNYSDVPRGSQFIVWAAPVSNTGVVSTDELVFGYYTPMEVLVEAAGEVSFNEVPVSLTLYGAQAFYVGHVDKKLCFNYNTEQYDLKEYLSSYISYLQYGVNYVGKEFKPGEYEVSLNELVNDMEEVTKLNPGSEYFAYVLPIISGKALTDYSFDDVLVFEFETTPLVEGGSLSVAFENAEQSYTMIAADMTSEGAEMVYYNWYTVNEYNELEDAATDLIENGYIFAGGYGAANKSLKPGESYLLAAVAVDSEGQYGEVCTTTLTAPKIVFSETLVATLGEPVFVEYTQYGQTNYKVTVPITVEGGEAAKYYYYWNTTARTAEQLEQLPLGTSAYYYYLNSATAPKDLVFYKSSTSYQFAVVVESTTGELSKPVIITVNNPDNE